MTVLWNTQLYPWLSFVQHKYNKGEKRNRVTGWMWRAKLYNLFRTANGYLWPSGCCNKIRGGMQSSADPNRVRGHASVFLGKRQEGIKRGKKMTMEKIKKAGQEEMKEVVEIDKFLTSEPSAEAVSSLTMLAKSPQVLDTKWGEKSSISFLKLFLTGSTTITSIFSRTSRKLVIPIRFSSV